MSWLLRRLRAMSAPEIGRRLVCVGDLAWLRLRRASIRRHAGGAVQQEELQRAPGIDLARALELIAESERKAIVEVARVWAADRGTVFELDGIALDGEEAWRRDPRTGRGSPRVFCGFLDHRNPQRVGDVRYVWELSRMQHLVPLALAARWTGDERFARALIRHCRDWQAQNPFLQGVNWKSPLELALRLVTWVMVDAILEDFPWWTDFVRESLAVSLYQHQLVVARQHSHGSSANNHLIGEMTGLYLAARRWPCWPESRAWSERAKVALSRAVLEQIHPDGVLREQASEYQLFVLELGVLAASLGEAAEDPFPDGYWRRLARALDVLVAISDRAGAMAHYGDGDGSGVLKLADGPSARLAALHPPVETDRKAGRAPSPRRTLLTWGTAASLPIAPTGSARDGLTAFPDGGLYVFAANRGSNTELLTTVRAGSFGLGPTWAHAHADQLSVTLGFGGERFLVDTGTYGYFCEPEWRDYFRSAAAHNTLRIDGIDQARMTGRFLWRAAPKVSARSGGSGSGSDAFFVEGRLAYEGLASPVIWRRRVELQDDPLCLVIEDHLDTTHRHEVELFFHLGSGCRLRRLARSAYRLESGAVSCVLELDPSLEVREYRATTDPCRGWVSPGFGVLEHTTTLVGRRCIASDIVLRSSVVPALPVPPLSQHRAP